MKNILLFSAGILLAGIAPVVGAQAELYKNFDGSYIREDIYEQNVMICSKFQQDGQIDNNADCMNWVLTQEGNDWLTKYWNFKLYGK